MSGPNKPYWRQLYLIGAVGAVGLVVEMAVKVKVPPQAHLMLLFGWVALVFSLISKWVIDNSSALNTTDDDARPPMVVNRKPTQLRPAPVCERSSKRLNQVKPGKSKTSVRRGKTI